MNIRTALHLGRVSNLPTVWTNCIAGALLSGEFLFDSRVLYLLLSMSLLYISGMFLNDAFDSDVDTEERPARPIPSGQVTRRSVFLWSGSLMRIGLFILYIGTSFLSDSIASLQAAVCLCILIVVYDWKHKKNFFAPFLMGMCRGMLYITAGLIYTSSISYALAIGALLSLAWTIGLTYFARQEVLDKIEKFWPISLLVLPVIYAIFSGYYPIPVLLLALSIVIVILYSVCLFRTEEVGCVGKVVSILIASLSLVDGLLLAIAGYEIVSFIISAAMLLTLFQQRVIPGT